MITPQTEVIGVAEGNELFRGVLPPGEYVIGRDEGVQIRLVSAKVSRRHALLTLNYYNWMIEDLGSANGTVVGGKSISEAATVFPKQDILVGNVQLHLRRLESANDQDSIPPQTQTVLKYLPKEVRGHRKYTVRSVIAVGGMGAILEAEDDATRRRVAMKTLLPHASAEDVARFVEEGQITAQLEHPNIVPVYELNVNELDVPFYVMKLVRGESLHQVLQRLRLEHGRTQTRYPLSELLVVLQKICDAVAFAHSKGVVHRDLKPANIMVGEFGETVVMDWGLAKPLGKSAGPGDRLGSLRTIVRTSRRESPEEVGTSAGTSPSVNCSAVGEMSPRGFSHRPFRSGCLRSMRHTFACNWREQPGMPSDLSRPSCDFLRGWANREPNLRLRSSMRADFVKPGSRFPPRWHCFRRARRSTS